MYFVQKSWKSGDALATERPKIVITNHHRGRSEALLAEVSLNLNTEK